MYNALGQYNKAELALRKAIAADPKDTQAYNNLGQTLAHLKRYDEAIPQYLKQIEVRPKNPYAHANLGRVYFLTNQYQKALAELDIAATITPDDASIPFNQGRVYEKLNEPDKAAKALEKPADLQPNPVRLNDVAYEMSTAKLDLPQARKYALSAIASTVQQMRDTTLDAVMASRIATFWDTWGWIRFQDNQVADAEKYIACAWMIRSNYLVAEHLGQIYEKQGRKSDALHMYQMALAADPKGSRTHLTVLAGPDTKIDVLIEEGQRLLKGSKTLSGTRISQ